MDDPSQLAACCTTMPRLQASLIGLLEKLVAEVAAGLPQRPPRPGSGCALPVPEELLAVLPDCWLFAPIKVGRGCVGARAVRGCSILGP